MEFFPWLCDFLRFCCVEGSERDVMAFVFGSFWIGCTLMIILPNTFLSVAYVCNWAQVKHNVQQKGIRTRIKPVNIIWFPIWQKTSPQKCPPNFGSYKTNDNDDDRLFSIETNSFGCIWIWWPVLLLLLILEGIFLVLFALDCRVNFEYEIPQFIQFWVFCSSSGCCCGRVLV